MRYWIDGLIVCVCLILLGILGRNEWTRMQAERETRLTATAMVGRKVAGLPRSAGQAGTVILILSPTCPYCARSLPFYQALLQKVRDSKGRMGMAVKLVTGSAESYLRQNGLEGATDLNGARTAFPVKTVPTLLVADAQDRVVRAWVGYLEDGKREEVYRVLTGLCHDCEFKLLATAH